MDNALMEVIKKIPQQAQRQYDLEQQLRHLYDAASHLGLYDAGDFIRKAFDKDYAGGR